ncbi:MAG: YraN family protein [Prochlorotrichaceae cyanobacterium]|jgi:putative endonuclease
MATDRAKRGQLGEQLVAEWLKSQGWNIVALRWHCRWGEIDVIAQGQSITGFTQSALQRSFEPIEPILNNPQNRPRAIVDTLAFVEVKTRNFRNWDQGGAQAITAQKCQKLWQTAEVFLGKFPQFAQWNCRFDVALVTCEPLKRSVNANLNPAQDLTNISIEIGKTIVSDGYELTLQRYLSNAFEGVE